MVMGSMVMGSMVMGSMVMGSMVMGSMVMGRLALARGILQCFGGCSKQVLPFGTAQSSSHASESEAWAFGIS